MSIIAVKNVVAYGNYGVSDEERSKKQPISFTVKVFINTDKAESSDDIDQTISWSELRNKIIQIIETNSYKLMERLGAEIINYLLSDERIHKVKLTLEKPEAFESGVPALTITKTKS